MPSQPGEERGHFVGKAMLRGRKRDLLRNEPTIQEPSGQFRQGSLHPVPRLGRTCGSRRPAFSSAGELATPQLPRIRRA